MLANEKRQVEPVDSVVSIRLEQPRRVTKWKLVALATAAIFYSLTHLTSAPIIDWAGPALLTSSQTVGTTKWWPCGDDAECGTMIVPKDYFNTSAGMATIALARYKARKHPKRGSVMTNPGGPGVPGRMLGSKGGKFFHDMLGADWDIIGFDPRGIGETTPKTQCFPDRLSHHLFLANTVFELGYTVPNVANISDPINHAALVEQQRQWLVLKQAQAERCKEHMDVEDLRYMGTATVVRDMDFMTRILDGEDAKINFWSGSYGSILGAYLVNMLPHRVGYVSIDGIVDPVSWANEPSHKWHKGWVSSAETTYQMFLSGCSEAGPHSCPLAKEENEDPNDIQDRIENFIQSLVASPLPVASGLRPSYLTSGAARSVLFMALERPDLWRPVAQGFSEAMGPAANGTRLLSYLLRPITLPPGNSSGDDLVRFGVTCMDSPTESYPTAEELADELIEAHKTSPHFGASPIITEPDGGCQFWPVKKGPERFTGPWNATLERPMLIISNTGDPITPIASGRLINSLMGNSSTLIIQEGPGHTSGAVLNTCVLKLSKEYWSGKTPANGTSCKAESNPFEDPNGVQAFGTMSVEDQNLATAWKEIWSYILGARRASF